MKGTMEKTARIAALCFAALALCAQAEVADSKASITESSATPAGNDRDETDSVKADDGQEHQTGGWSLVEQSGPFLRLTEIGPPTRTTAVYTENVFRTDRDFTMRLDVRMGGEKDEAGGLSLMWFDALTFEDYVKSGDAARLKGYALNLAFSGKDGSLFDGRAELVNLHDGLRVDGTEGDLSLGPDFNPGKGRQTIQFDYAAESDAYKLSWGYDGSPPEGTLKYPGGATAKFGAAYFAVRTAGEKKDRVDNIKFVGVPATDSAVQSVPEPGTWAAAVLLAAIAAYAGWRKRRAS